MIKQNCTTCCWSGKWIKGSFGATYGTCTYPDVLDVSSQDDGVYEGSGSRCPFDNLPPLAEVLAQIPADWLELERQANQRKALEKFVQPTKTAH